MLWPIDPARFGYLRRTLLDLHCSTDCVLIDTSSNCSKSFSHHVFFFLVRTYCHFCVCTFTKLSLCCSNSCTFQVFFKKKKNRRSDQKTSSDLDSVTKTVMFSSESCCEISNVSHFCGFGMVLSRLRSEVSRLSRIFDASSLAARTYDACQRTFISLPTPADILVLFVAKVIHA